MVKKSNFFSKKGGSFLAGLFLGILLAILFFAEIILFFIATVLIALFAGRGDFVKRLALHFKKTWQEFSDLFDDQIAKK
jgi:predicted lipid-binding transport protein (Tim44 family)